MNWLKVHKESESLHVVISDQDRFLLVKFQLDYVLDMEEPRDAIEALSTLPKDMPDAYNEVLTRIGKTKGKRTAIKVLS